MIWLTVFSPVSFCLGSTKQGDVCPNAYLPTWFGLYRGRPGFDLTEDAVIRLGHVL